MMDDDPTEQLLARLSLPVCLSSSVSPRLSLSVSHCLSLPVCLVPSLVPCLSLTTTVFLSVLLSLPPFVLRSTRSDHPSLCFSVSLVVLLSSLVCLLLHPCVCLLYPIHLLIALELRLRGLVDQCCPTLLTPRAAQDTFMKPRAARANSEVTPKIC